MLLDNTKENSVLASTLGVRIPSVLSDKYVSKTILNVYDQEEIMKAIDFTPPFLRIYKMVVFSGKNDSAIGSIGLGTGIITPQDTNGHYNGSIYLAMCGWLMGSSASVHLATLFPMTAPQVIEVDHIRPTKDTTLWKPHKSGSHFFVETTILKKKLQLVVANVRIYFGNIYMGEVEKLKLMLTPRDSISNIQSLPEWR